MRKMIYVFVALIVFSGCDNFLDVKPKGVLVPEKVEDFDLILNDIHITVGGESAVMDPYVYPGKESNAAKWGEKVFFGDDYQFNGFYTNLYKTNYILENIDAASTKGNNPNLKAKVKRDALAERAASLFLIANIYGAHYNPATYNQDVAASINLTSDIEADLPNNTIKEFYDQILEDLLAAKNVYSSDNNRIYNNIRATNVGIDGLLSKVYLFMNDHVNAFKYADACLKSYDFLYDYNDLDSDNLIPVEYFNNKENIWFKTPKPAINGVNWYYSGEMADLHDRTNDLRWRLYAGDALGDGGYNKDDKIMFSPNSLVSVPDILLIRAECYAKLGEVENALDDLNRLRARRISRDAGSDVVNISTNSKDEALQFIREERVRELAFTVNNLWDLKRYYVEGREVPTFSRTISPDPKTYTLEPGSDKYYLEISSYILGLSKNLKANK